MGYHNHTTTNSGFAVLWCPDFRLQAVARGERNHETPLILVDDSKRQSVVLCGNDRAYQWEVEASMSTVQALARCPGLQVRRPSAAAEETAARLLLEAALSWVPGMEETEPGLLTLDLASQPSEEWEQNGYRVQRQLADLGFSTVIGMGQTPSLARIAAVAARESGEILWHLDPDRRLEFLDRLPLTIAETGAELNERLHLWGVKTLGSFARLSHQAVAARLGEEGVELWLRLTGRLQRPLRQAQLEHLFEERYEFDYELNDKEPLFFLINRLIERLSNRVSRTGRAAAAVVLVLTFTDGSCYAKRLALPEPTLEHEVLFRIISGHIEQIEMKTAVESLLLRYEPADRVSSQRLLFGAGLRNIHQFQETLKRLRKLVGSDFVGSPRFCDTHRPGTCELVPLPHDIPAIEDDENTLTGPPTTGPIFRKYPTAATAAVRLRDGYPIMVESSRINGVVIEHYGPWKCEGDWWHQGKIWNRTEWDIELLNQGLFRLIDTGRRWIIEGYYD
ncbi:MAG: hypothetical protein CMO55_11635 [Verrucomicrobiales bacterium]|nr:hypothetical protein [Verrucomicrobiales bacterium]